jgi:hypothetical protein
MHVVIPARLSFPPERSVLASLNSPMTTDLNRMAGGRGMRYRLPE